jgi:hypothetical protein
VNRSREFFSFLDPVRFVSAQLTLSHPFSLPDAVSHPVDVVTPLSRVTLPSHRVKTSLLSPVHLPSTLHPHRLPSQFKTEVLNLHHRHWPPSSDSSTLTLHCYKNVISTLVILSITQSRLHFTSSIIRIPHH